MAGDYSLDSLLARIIALITAFFNFIQSNFRADQADIKGTAARAIFG
ncbi:MAG: hypothetical protein K6C36_03895 [Clostridia bacterium]|nr:hypothetical protein [Clostridia bacterium]